MASTGKEYCDFLHGELTDMKKRLDTAIERSGVYSREESGFESVACHLRDIESVIEAKIDTISHCCPNCSM